MVAATPGLDRMPAPTTLTRAIESSDVTPPAPTSVASRFVCSMARARSAWGTVNEMSVTP